MALSDILLFLLRGLLGFIVMLGKNEKPGRDRKVAEVAPEVGALEEEVAPEEDAPQDNAEVAQVATGTSFNVDLIQDGLTFFPPFEPTTSEAIPSLNEAQASSSTAVGTVVAEEDSTLKHHVPLWRAVARTRMDNLHKASTIDASTPTNLDATPTDISHGDSPSETKTVTKSPLMPDLFVLTAPVLTSTVREILITTESAEYKETLQELADSKAQIKSKDEEIEHYKGRLTEVTESRDEQTQQDSGTQTGPDQININIQERFDALKQEWISLRLEENAPRDKLGQEESRASALRAERAHLRDYIVLKQREIEKLKEDAMKTSKHIRVGFEELKKFIGLSTKMYNGLNEGAGAMGRDGRFMRSARRQLALWNALMTKYFRDVARTEAEVVSEHDLAVIRRPSTFSATSQEVDEFLESLGTNGDISGVGAEASASANAKAKKPQTKSRKTSKTASVFAAAAGIDLSSSSSPSSAAKGKQKEERTPASGQEGSRIFSFASSEDDVRGEQTPRHQDPESTSQSFNFSTANPFNFSASASKGKEKEERTPASGQEGSRIFSFVSSEGSVRARRIPEHQDPQVTSPIFNFSSRNAFDFSASAAKGKEKEQPTPNFGAEGSSTFSFSPPTSAPPSSSNAGTGVPFNDDDLYTIEEGYVHPADRPAVVNQAGVEPASTANTNEAEDANGSPTEVPRIIITPPSTSDDQAQVGNSNILERNGFDVAALSRIVGSGSAIAHENPQTSTRQDDSLEAVNHGATESLLARLLPREGHYPSFEQATGIRNVDWHGRGRTAEGIFAECERVSEARSEARRLEDDLALITSGIENLHLGSWRPSGGSQPQWGNPRGDGGNGCAETDDEPQTPKVVEEDVSETRAAEVLSGLNEAFAAMSIDGAVQPQTGLQVGSTAPSSSSPYPSSSSSAPVSTPLAITPSATAFSSTTSSATHEPPESSSSSDPSSSSSEAPATTPSAITPTAITPSITPHTTTPPSTTPPSTTHTPPAPERRSHLGNPMDQNGLLYIWYVWPLIRRRRPRLIGVPRP